jgi:hypothetical protein
MSSRITPPPPKLTPDAITQAIDRFVSFYALNVAGTEREEMREAVDLLHQSIGLDEEAVECFFDNAGQLLPDFGELESLFLSAMWQGMVIGLSAAAYSDEDAAWATDTPDIPAELLARAEE